MTTSDHDQAAAVARRLLGIPTPDLAAALKVETTVELVDHEGLGIVVSELTSKQQARFLIGLADGFSRFDSKASAGFQLAWLAREFDASPGIARSIADLLRDLVAHLDEVTKP